MGRSCQDLFEQVRHMKITLPLAIASLFVLHACSPGAKPTAPGTYTLDMEEVIEAMEEKWETHAAQLSGRDIKHSRAFAKTMLDLLKSITATLEVRADKTFEIIMKGKGSQKSSTGTWALDGDSFTIVGIDEDGVEVTKWGRLKADGIHFEDGVGDLKGAVVFRRAE